MSEQEERMRREDREAQNAIAMAYGLEPPYSKEELIPEDESKQARELRLIKERAQERKDRITELCAAIESLEIESGPAKGIQIAHAVAEAHGLNWQQFISRRRHKNLSKARQHAMWEIHRLTTLSLPAIGRLLGGLDHTTILYGIRAHQKRIDNGEFGR